MRGPSANAAVVALAAALASVALAPAALAQDLTLSPRDATPVSERAVGQAYWRLEAQCAGLYAAVANMHTAHGLDGQAAHETSQGVVFMDDAISQLQLDRKLGFQEALSLAGSQADAARARGSVAWRNEHGMCLDVYDAYHHHRR
jgi:hypothetical protein